MIRQLEALQPISLDELNAVAALQKRQDRKYIVSGTDLVELMMERTSDLRVLEIDHRRVFGYESVYFDTPSLHSYAAAAHQRRRRFKVRTRVYTDSGLCFLEVKLRERKGWKTKLRLPYAPDDRGHLTPEGLDFLRQFELVGSVGPERLEPVLVTRFDRITLLHSTSHSRVTIDTGLVWENPDGERFGVEDVAIIETKTEGGSSPIDRFLWSSHVRPERVSKYGAGMAAFNPWLPANRWNRLLRTYFDWTPIHSGELGEGACPNRHIPQGTQRSFQLRTQADERLWAHAT